MTDHAKGLMYTLIGMVLILPDTVFLRIISAEPMVSAFWRSLFAGSFILTVILLTQGTEPFRAVLRTGWPALIYILIISTTAPAIVMAVHYTSVANVVFIFATIPIFAVIFGKVFLGEAIKTRMILTIMAVFSGLGVIAFGSSTSELSSWKGDLWAIYIAVAFAAALTAVRRVKDTSMVPALPFAYIGAACLLFIFVEPFTSFTTEWPLFLTHGSLIAAGACFLAIGPRYISASEVALIILLESALAPVLVWVVAGEYPGHWALIGGTIVIMAMIISNLYELLRLRRTSVESH